MRISTKKIFIHFRDLFSESRSFVLIDEKMVDEFRCIFIFEDRIFFSCSVNQILKLCMLLNFLCYQREDVMRSLYRV